MLTEARYLHKGLRQTLVDFKLIIKIHHKSMLNLLDLLTMYSTKPNFGPNGDCYCLHN